MPIPLKSILVALVLLGPPSLAEDSTKKVFAHYMVCNPSFGGDSKIEDYQKEIRAARTAGIDGFALNCGGWSVREPNYKKRTLLIYEAAKQLSTDFKLFISADYATHLTLDETRDMVESFRDHLNQFRWNGRPVLSTFGGREEQKEFIRAEFTNSRAICFVPFFYPKPAAEMPKQAQVDQVFRDHGWLDGFFHFGAAGPADEIVRSNHLLAEKWLGAGKIFMAGITPFYRGLGGNYRIAETRGFEGMAQEWEAAIRDNATWVEIVTWNDWGESSYISPFDTPQSPRLSHAAWLEASRHYIAWYKTGTRPKIAEDAIYYFYRLHSKNIPGIKTPGEPPVFPRGADKLEDSIFVSAFLTAPARLTIRSGETEKNFDLPAGVNHVSTPFAPGRPRFVLARDAKTLIAKTGEEEISATEPRGNFNYFSGSAKSGGR